MMFRLYKSHGKHCVLRSFPTKCPKCKEDVFYWECTHGSKLFFNYPVYGKLIRHICKKKILNRKNKFPVIVKPPEKLFKEEKSYCSVCGKHFKTTVDLDSHLNELRKLDPLHKQYFENRLIFKSRSLEEVFLKKNEKKSNFKPKFGRINIKKRNL
ncbi:MAG: hypothetical protein EU540_02790 [Promethearchaeota archaeon]|nr:MAG: hypothetical protein EU540_02790 [Candidatus Lokiarchaeota archaeon]